MRRMVSCLAAGAAILLATAACAQTAPGSASAYEPVVGQDGKDVIWVPTQPKMVERMLRMAQVTPGDLVVDLGSGDGRIAIAAARDFGARARGLEYNPDMVALSIREAAKAGVSGRVSFEQADIFKADFSTATVVTMFLLPGLNMELRPLLLKMKPGTRVVSNQFDMGDWVPDEQADLLGRLSFLWIVPAPVAGTWKFNLAGTAGNFDISFKQIFQRIGGWVVVENGKSTLRDAWLSGDRLRFALVDDKSVLHEFDGRIKGNTISGSERSGSAAPIPFTAQRVGE